MCVKRYDAIWEKHQPLYNLSRTVRYTANPALWVPYACIEKQVLGRYLYPIEKSAFGLMGIEYPFERIVLSGSFANH